jgi:acetylornithine deacetylase
LVTALNSAEREKIVKTVDEKSGEYVKFLRELVRIPSVMVTDEEKKAQQFVSKKLENLGCLVDVWETDWDELKNAISKRTGKPLYVPVETWITDYQGLKNRPNVVGAWKGTGGGRSLILNGHVDVVPPGVLDRWTHDPWGGEIEDGLLYGRGATDMKAGVAAMILALDCIKSVGVRLKGDVILESVIDEETGGNGTLGCMLRGYRADAGIFTEPTNLEVAVSHSGAQFFRVNVPGKMVHIGYKDEGINAIEKGAKIITALADWEAYRTRTGHQKYPEYRRYLTPFPLVCGAIKAGTEMVIPECPAELCTIEGAFQSMPDEEISEVNSDLEAFISKAASIDPWMRDHPPKIEFFGLTYEGARVDPAHPLVRMITDTFQETLGKAATVSAFPTGCDMRLYTNHGDTPSIIFGPGSARNAHFVDEYVPLSQYLDSIKILAVFIANWCGCSEAN